MTASKNALSTKAFRLFTMGSVCLFCGWWLRRVTLAWAVWSSSSSPFWLGIWGLLRSFRFLSSHQFLAPSLIELADSIS